MGHSLPEMLEAELDHQANNAGSERLIEFFDLVAEQIGKFVQCDKLDVFEQELFAGEAVRGVTEDGIEAVVFHHSELSANVLVQRDGFCIRPSEGVGYNEGKLGYVEIYQLFADGSSLDLPQFDATPRMDEEDELDDEDKLEILEEDGEPVEIA